MTTTPMKKMRRRQRRKRRLWLLRRQLAVAKGLQERRRLIARMSRISPRALESET